MQLLYQPGCFFDKLARLFVDLLATILPLAGAKEIKEANGYDLYGNKQHVLL